MSWHPLRDSFDLPPETQAIIRALSERIDDEAREELHRDLSVAASTAWATSGTRRASL